MMWKNKLCHTERDKSIDRNNTSYTAHLLTSISNCMMTPQVSSKFGNDSKLFLELKSHFTPQFYPLIPFEPSNITLGNVSKALFNFNWLDT